LLFHPDKNPSPDTTVKFQEILEAYNYLNDNNNSNDSNNNKNSYSDILEKFLNGILNKNIDTKQLLFILNNKYSEITIELLKHFSKNTLVQLNKFINEYSDILHINKNIIDKINFLIKEYIKNDKIEIINPSLDNLINNDIYKLTYDNNTYYIPMWHHELIYDLSENSLIIQCEPEIPEYITLDQYNNLYVNLSTTITNVVNDNSITIIIADNKYIIPINELYIKKYQKYTLKSSGIALIDTKNIYNINNKANIFINIHFTDIK